MSISPTVPVRPAWVAGLTLATIGTFAAFFGPIQVLLAQQTEEIAAGDKELVFGVVTGVGAAMSMVANPLFGALSDRTTSRRGRRVPWVAAGALGAAAGLTLLAALPPRSGLGPVLWMVLGWCVVQAAGNALLAAITAAVPDRAPDRQRGVVGGWLALGQTLGALAGVGLAFATGGYRAGYLGCAVLVLVLAVPYLVRSDDAPVPPGVRSRLRLAEFWIDPRAYPDFGWAWLTRFVVQLSNSIGTLYLFFYLSDEVGHGDPEAGVLVLLVIYSVCVVLSSVTTGRWSDRTGRRKVFVIVAGTVMSAAGVLLAVWPSWPGVVAAAVLLGIGFGAFLAVDFAILTEVLPSAADRGKDLGVINIANSLPQVLAPAVAAPVIAWLGGYRVLYVVAAAVGLTGALLVRRIRAVS